MNVVTVTREYGAGGYEVARRLAELLGWELLDRELLHQAAAVEHLSDAELERLDEKAVTLADRFRLHPPHQRYLHGLTEAARRAAERGNVVLVGRGTGQLLGEHPNVLHLRLIAPLEWRAQRMADKEGWSLEEARIRCAEQDRSRERFNRYFFGDAPFQPSRYHLIFHTGRVPLGDVVTSVVSLLRGVSGADLSSGRFRDPSRLLTLSRELGAGGAAFVSSLAERLDLKVCDRELLEQEAMRLGVSEAEVARIDEQPSGFFQRFRSGSLQHRYFEVLGQIMNDLAVRGNVLIVGRGGSRFLRDAAGAFHVRLVADPSDRVRRVMENRWVRDSLARQIITESDTQRRRFFEGCFGSDWADPLEYHLTVNGARLASAAVEVVAQAASRHWGYVGTGQAS
jgi:cytidylate kinase